MPGPLEWSTGRHGGKGLMLLVLLGAATGMVLGWRQRVYAHQMQTLYSSQADLAVIVSDACCII